MEQENNIQQRNAHQHSQPLTEGQEVLADTAKSFVDGLQADSGIMKENPKLAKSQFMSLIIGIGERKVVAEEETKMSQHQKEQDGSLAGARFVTREPGNTNGSVNTAGWASDFASTSTSSFQPLAGVETEVTALHVPENGADAMFGRTDGPVHRSFGHYTSLQRANAPTQLPLHATNQVSQSDWDRQFTDQEAIVQSHTRPATSSRRKSVHFDKEEQEEFVRPMGNGVPSSLEEALAMSATGIPGMSSAWQEEGMDDELDFDEETFYGFNGPMRVAKESNARSKAQVEGWSEMEGDWEAYERQTGVIKGKGRGHYLFQKKNPYTPDVRDMAELSPISPTFKVSKPHLCPAFKVGKALIPGCART